MSSLHVRKGDTVKILTGKDKGKQGKISAVNIDDGRVIVDGANIIIKHIKPKSAQQPGSIQKVAGSIDASNVQIVCPACSKATRVKKTEVEIKGKKKMQRTCKKCDASLDIKTVKADKKKKSKKDDVKEEKAEDKKTSRVTKKDKDKEDKKPSGDGITSKNEDGAVV